MSRFRLAALMLLTVAPLVASAAAPIAVIPATSRKDVVFDRYGILYISSADRLIRYDVRKQTLLPDLVVSGGNLAGMDIDRSSCRIAVADYNPTDSQTNRIWLVNNGETTATAVPLVRAFGEGGTYDVAFVGANDLYVTANYNGSGWVPLRRVALSDGTTQTLRDIRQSSMIATSYDGRYYAYSESNISSGPVILGDTATNGILSTINTQWFMFEIGIAPDGSVITAPSYDGSFVFDRVGSQLSQRPGVIGQYATWGPLAMTFATHTSAAFASLWGGPSDPHGLVVYPNSSFAAPITIDAYDFDWGGNGGFVSGRMKLSPDGRYLAVTIANAVAVYDVSFYASNLDLISDDQFESCDPF